MGTAIILAIILGTIGVALLMTTSIVKSTKKKTLHVIFGIISLTTYISFLCVICFTKPIEQTSGVAEYPIQKLTFNSVAFDNRNAYGLDESYVNVERADGIHNNVVVVDEKYYVIRWLWEIPFKKYKYHVYLSEDNYQRLQNRNVIYEITE